MGLAMETDNHNRARHKIDLELCKGKSLWCVADKDARLLRIILIYLTLMLWGPSEKSISAWPILTLKKKLSAALSRSRWE